MTDFPAPPPSPDAPRPYPRWVLFALVGTAALLLVVTIVVVFSAFKGGPTDATERYLEAVRDRDKSRVEALVCPGSRSLVDAVEDEDEVVEWRMINETISGDTARVHASITVADDGETQNVAAVFSLVKVDGDWNVCDIS